ncbi:MAG: ParB/RepB/Spo0J family partition protein [Deltaproteobacteria bacterium]|nr:ParB/RepB/Spo0J family partition protein [Deltaproteobacteria bacterium]
MNITTVYDEKSTINFDMIFPNPDQPRKVFNEDRLRELADSILRHGLMEPIIVTRRETGFMIVAGERRYRACVIAGLTDIPVRIIEADERKVAELALLENLQREDLNILEEANAYKELMEFGMTMEEVANAMGFKQVWRIQERLNLLKLDPIYQECTLKNIISPSQAQELSRLSIQGQRILFKQIKDGKADTYNKLRALANAIIYKEEHGEQDSFIQTPTKEEIQAKRKYDRMLDGLVSFIQKSFDKEDLTVLERVVSSSLQVNIQKIDMIMDNLKKIKMAMLRSESAGEIRRFGNAGNYN